MSVQLQKRLITADEFADYPEDCRYDLIKGELVDMPPMPGPAHGDSANILSTYVSLHVIEHNLGRGYVAETRFTIERNPDTAIAPDWRLLRRRVSPPFIRRGAILLWFPTSF